MDSSSWDRLWYGYEHACYIILQKSLESGNLYREWLKFQVKCSIVFKYLRIQPQDANMPADHFQVKLSGNWKDYKGNEDKILKRAYLAGFPHAKYKLRGQSYEVDFKSMSQKNMRTGKSRDIRAPYKWKQPEKPIVDAGPTFCIKVPPGSPGTCIHVPHPAKKGQFIAVNVPAKAKVGAAMLVPIPKDEDLPVPVPDAPTPSTPVPAPATGPEAPATTEAEKEKKKGGWSTGAKVAAGTAGVVAVGGLAVAGAVLGEHIAEEGWDATMAELGDVAADAGEAIAGAAEDVGEAVAGAAEDAGEWIAGAAEDAGDFIMDLFWEFAFKNQLELTEFNSVAKKLVSFASRAKLDRCALRQLGVVILRMETLNLALFKEKNLSRARFGFSTLGSKCSWSGWVFIFLSKETEVLAGDLMSGPQDRSFRRRWMPRTTRFRRIFHIFLRTKLEKTGGCWQEIFSWTNWLVGVLFMFKMKTERSPSGRGCFIFISFCHLKYCSTALSPLCFSGFSPPALGRSEFHLSGEDDAKFQKDFAQVVGKLFAPRGQKNGSA